MIELKTTAIKQEKLLYTVLKTTKEELEHVIKNRKSYYNSYYKIIRDKRDKIIYENGLPKKRSINYTNGRLNDFQTIIARKILSKIPLPPNVKGSVKGNSNIANAKVHLGKHYKFKTDIKKYFPSINHERVFNMYIQNGFSSKVATLLTHITTNNYELPQGTPTSSAIANLVFVPNDNKINEYCKLHNLTHTRYVDDIVFSSHFDFKEKVLDIIQFILDDGFRISVKKTIYTSGSLEITGVLTKQNVLDATDEYKELINDLTIDPKKTEARKKYVNRIKAKSKTLSSNIGIDNRGS
ncbi:MAG TPA: reverse transcriptase family protein [Chitinophagaceae bacterium]|jgi:RNA-directed DNA polymerase|nr:reverse transcriptase family protein [Chitinophagaceae bacterium]